MFPICQNLVDLALGAIEPKPYLPRLFCNHRMALSAALTAEENGPSNAMLLKSGRHAGSGVAALSSDHKVGLAGKEYSRGKVRQQVERAAHFRQRDRFSPDIWGLSR